MARRFATLILISLAAASCGSGEPSTPAAEVVASTTSAPTTTTAAPTTTTAAPTTTVTIPTADELAEAGPYEVGVTTRTLPTGNLIEIYYPSTDAAAGRTEEYRIRTFVPAALAAILPVDTPDSFAVDAARDAPGSPDGPFPIVLFSHGFSGFRLQSTALLRHLASWGMVVASPDHPERDLAHIIGEPTETPPDPADDLRATLAVVADAPGDPVLDNLADATRVALGGHSAGGFTILSVAGDDGIVGYVSYASGADDDTELPEIPSLFLAGSNDKVIPPALTAAAFERAPSPTWMWTLGATGHLAFSDLCSVGGGDSTLIDLADAAGVGELITPDLRRLGTDGCEPPNRPVEDVWPAIFQASTGFYRWVFGLDSEPAGLSSTSVDDVVIVSR